MRDPIPAPELEVPPELASAVVALNERYTDEGLRFEVYPQKFVLEDHPRGFLISCRQTQHAQVFVTEHLVRDVAGLENVIAWQGKRLAEKIYARRDPYAWEPQPPLSDWALPFRRRCRAVRESDGSTPYFGRCELRRGHSGDHALERGMDVPRWSTRWTG